MTTYKRYHLVVFLLVLTAGALLYFTLNYSRYIDGKSKNQHQESLNQIAKSLTRQKENLIFGLQGTAGLYHVSNFRLSNQEFKKYSTVRNDFSNFRAAMGFGFIRYVKNKNLNKYTKESLGDRVSIKTIDKDYASLFDDHFVIETIEPLERNEKALGLDIGSERNRRETAWGSAQSGEFRISPPIDLVQEQKIEPGFLVYLPIYENFDPNINQLVGWAYAPLGISLFLSEILDFKSLRIKFNITTLDHNDKKYVLYSGIDDDDLLNSKDKFRTSIDMGGQRWDILGVPKNNFQQTTSKIILWVAFALVILILILIGLWIFKLQYHIEEAVKAVGKAEKWNEAVLNSSSYSIIATSPDGTILTFNKKAESLLGYSAEEVINRETPAIFHESEEVLNRSIALSSELDEKIEPGFRTFVIKADKQESDINEWTYVRKNGSKFPVRLCVTALRDSQNKIFGYLGIAENLTEQKQLQMEIERQKSMMINSSKMSALGEMAGGIAHEINNPLAVISSYSNLMKKLLEADSFDSAKFVEAVEKIEKTVDRITKIIVGLRNFSRNADSDHFSDTFVKTIVDDTLELCYGKFLSHEVKLTVETDLNIKIKCKATQISQVLMNLLSNALDAVKNNDEKWVKLFTQREDDFVHIVVRDSGHGIPKQIVEKIMEPFYTTKEVGEGTGLGLSISLGILTSHGGSLVYEEYGGNTQFRMILPLDPKV